MIGFHLGWLGIVLLAFAPAPDPSARKESGMVVSRVNRTLVVMDTDQKTTRKYEVPAEAPVNLDGKPAKLDDLQPGDMVDVSLGAEQRVVAVNARSGKLKTSQLAERPDCEVKACLSSAIAAASG